MLKDGESFACPAFISWPIQGKSVHDHAVGVYQGFSGMRFAALGLNRLSLLGA
jgi:hypothetical protein